MKLENVELAKTKFLDLKQLENDLEQLLELHEVPLDKFEMRVFFKDRIHIRAEHLPLELIFKHARNEIESRISKLKKEIKKL